MSAGISSTCSPPPNSTPSPPSTNESCVTSPRKPSPKNPLPTSPRSRTERLTGPRSRNRKGHTARTRPQHSSTLPGPARHARKRIDQAPAVLVSFRNQCPDLDLTHRLPASHPGLTPSARGRTEHPATDVFNTGHRRSPNRPERRGGERGLPKGGPTLCPRGLRGRGGGAGDGTGGVLGRAADLTGREDRAFRGVPAGSA